MWLCLCVCLGMKEFATSHFMTQNHVNLSYLFMRDYYDGVWHDGLERHHHKYLLQSQIEAFSVNHKETSTMWTDNTVFVFFSMFGSLVNRSDFKNLSWKRSHVQKYETLHMSSWDLFYILCSVTTVNTSSLQKDCTDFIITADKSRTASVKPCLWHYDQYCK